MGAGLLGPLPPRVCAAEDQLDCSVENYDAALVTLIGDVATNYVQMRQTQEQIALSKQT